MSTLEIVSAWYGTEKDVVGDDITSIVKNFIAEGRTSIAAENEVLGVHPCVGCVKTMWVTYSVDGGETKKVVETPERETLDVSTLI
jgi:hypothetical protein